MKALPPAVTIGAMATGTRIPIRLCRNKPRQATGRVTKVLPTAVRVSNEAGCFLIDRLSVREIRS